MRPAPSSGLRRRLCIIVAFILGVFVVASLYNIPSSEVVNIQIPMKAKNWDASGEKPKVTFVTCPKSFPSRSQMLGLMTWLTLDPQPEIIYVSDDPGVAEVAAEYGIRHITNVRVNEYGTPLLDFIFHEAQEQARGEIIVFLNTDILTLQNFMDVLLYVVELSRKLDNFLVVGPRQDTDLDPSFYTVGSDWHEKFANRYMNKGVWTSSTALDYFIFKKGFFPEFPPFAIGRFVWDTWIMSHSLHGQYPTINGKNQIQAFHVNHHYKIAGLPSDGLNNAALEAKQKSPEFKENMRLGAEYGGLDGGELQCAEYLISKCGNEFCLIKNNGDINEEYCKHERNNKISDEKLREINDRS
eukprot:TRINITY_DN3268_c0_g1_i1.p1 TRINITY_DN3268_c0_g1~~TRINITY_DN3268_c0_g1_i1.p1  ORF type:complete len:355 (+),score=75.22 TRINITY_DN3268_c0_g1_i1:653-1717(+)